MNASSTQPPRTDEGNGLLANAVPPMLPALFHFTGQKHKLASYFLRHGKPASQAEVEKKLGNPRV
jgi:hypothetical protein